MAIVNKKRTQKLRGKRTLHKKRTNTKKHTKGGFYKYYNPTEADEEYMKSFIECYNLGTMSRMVSSPDSCRNIKNTGITYRLHNDVKKELQLTLITDIIKYLSNEKNRSSLYFNYYSGLINNFLNKYDIYTYKLKPIKSGDGVFLPDRYSQEIISSSQSDNDKLNYNTSKYSKFGSNDNVIIKDSKLYVTKEMYEQLFFVISEVLKLYSYKPNTFVPMITQYISENMKKPLDVNKDCDCDKNYYYYFYQLFKESEVDQELFPSVLKDINPTIMVGGNVDTKIDLDREVQNILLKYVVLDIIKSLSNIKNRPYYYKNYSGIIKSIANKYIIECNSNGCKISSNNYMLDQVNLNLTSFSNSTNPTKAYGYNYLTPENKKNLVNMVTELLKMYEDDVYTGSDPSGKTKKQKNYYFLRHMYTYSLSDNEKREKSKCKCIKNIFYHYSILFKYAGVTSKYPTLIGNASVGETLETPVEFNERPTNTFVDEPEDTEDEDDFLSQTSPSLIQPPFSESSGMEDELNESIDTYSYPTDAVDTSLNYTTQPIQPPVVPAPSPVISSQASTATQPKKSFFSSFSSLLPTTKSAVTAPQPSSTTPKKGLLGLGFMGLGGGRVRKTQKHRGKSYRKRQTKKH